MDAYRQRFGVQSERPYAAHGPRRSRICRSWTSPTAWACPASRVTKPGDLGSGARGRARRGRAISARRGGGGPPVTARACLERRERGSHGLSDQQNDHLPGRPPRGDGAGDRLCGPAAGHVLMSNDLHPLAVALVGGDKMLRGPRWRLLRKRVGLPGPSGTLAGPSAPPDPAAGDGGADHRPGRAARSGPRWSTHTGPLLQEIPKAWENRGVGP